MLLDSPYHAEDISSVTEQFDADILKATCELPERQFGRVFGLDKQLVQQRKPHNFYYYKDNGSDVLAVAHLDTVVEPRERTARYMQTDAGLVIHSGALDDRLGAYVILELLPRLGLQHDILLTVGEERGQSTAEFFESPKEYNWIIEFDRGGTDVVMYDYETQEMVDKVRAARARVGGGSFSDISYMEHLGVKAFNWGVGYHDYHSPRGFAYLDDTFEMVVKYQRFHKQNEGQYLLHLPSIGRPWWDENFPASVK